jgi:SEC-C motif-containing protein
MRSRYAAFAVGDTAYVLSTWHPSTRPRSIAPETDLQWRRLDVLRTTAGGPFDTRGAVEFRAVWRQGAERGALHERSRFERVGGAWLYVDGDVLPD